LSLITRKVLNKNKLRYSVSKNSYYRLLNSGIKNMICHLKNWCKFDLTLMMPLKVKSVVPSYVPIWTIQLLFETFFRIYHSFREILMQYLKWDSLYIYRLSHFIRSIRITRKRNKIQISFLRQFIWGGGETNCSEGDIVLSKQNFCRWRTILKVTIIFLNKTIIF